MLIIKRFINKLMTSNCYVVSESGCRSCIVIDPGSEDCKEIIEYFVNQNLEPEYVFLTHEHSDHTWGCNTLIDKYDLKVITSKLCEKALSIESNAYFQFYFDDPDYTYNVKRVDIIIEHIDNMMLWCGNNIKFIATPGHSDSSICISIENHLFTGDTIMQCKPRISRKNGSKELYRQSIDKIIRIYSGEMEIYPGHGDVFKLKDYKI